MIEVDYTLYGDDGGIEYQERSSQQVPRAGELIGFEPNRSYQVIDVLWHLNKAGQDRVTVTACERDWHEHINDVMAEWRKAERNR